SPPHYQPSTSHRGTVPKSYTPPHSDIRQKPQRERLPGKKSQPEIEPSCSTRESSNFLDQSVDMGQPKEKKHRKHSSSHKKSSRDSSAERRSQKAVLSPRVKLLPKIESESVRVSHIKSPHEIYIQNLTFVTSVEHFVDMCSDVAQQQVKTEDILTGEMYLLKDIIGDNEKWYRAELKTYNSAESLYEMRLVDFGNVRKVTKSRVRTCPEILKKQPRGAIQCSLYNLHPRKGKWTDEVNCLLSELVQSDTITKMTLGTDGDVHLVDLIVMKNLTPISIRDTLIKVNLAKSITTTDHGMNQLIFELNKFINAAHSASPKFYAQTVTAGGYFAPKVIHIESLVEFYVMKALDIPMYENQGRAMDQHYENPKNMMDRVYSPEIGMPVALNYNDHWHRGEVIGIMGPLQVQVQLVDIGTKHTVSLRSLRILHSDFMKLSKGTIACALVHIAPTEHHNFQWPPEALETFRALTSTNNLELFVHSHHPSNNNFFNVTLYSVRKDKNISINAQLVQLEFATSTGSESIQ
uniref:Tudor domain-containing protein n=1 Tax=Phlebotomus papatasi TaxID=29031 RepID=A0A1B0DJZ2_PHLPP